MNRSFNLVDEPWIPVADHGLVSLRDVFSRSDLRSFGGTPVQKLAVMKLLLAITQSAWTPQNDEEWHLGGVDRLTSECMQYLDEWHERFDLYGDCPFLQMPRIVEAKASPFGALIPEVATGNTTVLTDAQCPTALSDADKALLLVTQMGFALSGKKTDNSVVLTPGYIGKQNPKGKPSSGRAGPSIGSAGKYAGYLHNFVLGGTLTESLWLNLLTEEQAQTIPWAVEGVGKAPWEEMPTGEDCGIARSLTKSLIGRLVPLCRFCLLSDEGVHYSEGIAHKNHKEGVADTSVAINYAGNEPKPLWVDPEKRPWRQLPALLAFLGQDSSQGFDSLQLSLTLDRASRSVETLAIWSAGLRVSNNAGEQYASGTDDYVDSQIWLSSEMLGAVWFAHLKSEMDGLNTLAKGLYASVQRYFKAQMADGGKHGARSTHIFWQLCERHFQALVDSCASYDEGAENRVTLRKRFAANVHHAYNLVCPKGTAKQLDAWAANRPNTRDYLFKELQ